MRTAHALLLARTLPTLRPVQVYGRILRAVRRARLERGPAPTLRRPVGAWARPARRAQSLLSPTRFRFLNEEREVADAAAWNDPCAARLWLYNLHYFDDLSAVGAERRRAWHAALIARWIRENPAGHGAGWEPFPTSLRVVAWLRHALGGAPLTDEARASLGEQVRWLRARLEIHLLGNHLLANAKALVFAGAACEGEEARGWLAEGLRVLRRELTEQVGADGGHFERSPMYHALVLEDLLDLVNLGRALPGAVPAADVACWRQSATRMRRWLACMVHPDGEIALFNDAAFGIAARPAELERYADDLRLGRVSAPGDGVELLAESGYVRIARGELFLLADVGEIGPRYLPGHAHADTLGFELSLFGERWVVDTGTSLYEQGEERSHQRSTRAHSTIEVDGADSSEVWAAFRVARRAHPRRLRIEERGDELSVGCAHDGYLRLPGRVLHRRVWSVAPRRLAVADRLRGRWRRASGALHLHPDVRVQGALLRRGALEPVSWALGGAVPTVEPDRWHPEFGVSLPASTLRYELSAASAVLRASW